MLPRVRCVILAAALAWAACESPAWGDDATQKLVDDASAVLTKAVEAPPTTEEQFDRLRQAFKTLVKHKPAGLSKVAWTLATDERQSDNVRGAALYALRDLPDSATDRVRTHVVAIVRNKKASRVLRMFAAFVLRPKRFADDDTRAVLEEVLLRRGDDDIVQRTCLSSLAATAKLARIRRVLLRRELYEHPYFGIRIDVCTGLAALNVRDRQVLDILCSLMTDKDPADQDLVVPQEAWLSFWVLTGRAYGVDDKKFARRPKPLASDNEVRDYLWRPAMLRKGVSIRMVWAVQTLTCRNSDKVRAQKTWGEVVRIRNTPALQVAADKSRRDFEAIVEEWRRKGK